MAWERITELGTQVNVASNNLSPEKTATFYNPKMCKNRMLVLCALTAAVSERGGEKVEKRIQKRMRCLDAFGATGITGLQWQLHHHDDVEVTVSDTNPESVRNMRRNCILNNLLAEDNLSGGKRLEQSDELKEEREDKGDVDRLHRGGTEVVVRINESMNKEMAETHCEKVKDQSDDGKNEKISKSSETPFSDNDSSRKDGTVTLVCCDANLLMRQRFFDFIFLDPYGCATPFMDSAFSNISNNGILAITSTDTASLYGKCPQVTLRNYGGQVAKCEYLKELAGRLVVAAAVRAAARCNKGLEVLLCVALEHFVLVILRVRRGSGQADRSVQDVQNVLHCRVCGQRKFVPSTLTVPNSMYDHLSCTCHKSAPRNSCTAMLLGPVWSGSIFDAGFIDRMAHAGVELRLSEKDLQLLHTLLEEATCSGPKSLQMKTSLPETKAHQTTMETGQKRGRLVDANDHSNTHDKRRRCNENQGQPAFYFSLPQHSIKNMDKPRIKTFIECLRMAGHRASRTHFDPEGVRTNAGLANFKAVLQDASTPTMK